MCKVPISLIIDDPAPVISVFYEHAQNLVMKDGRELICDTAKNIKLAAGTDNFEQAFVRIVKGERA